MKNNNIFTIDVEEWFHILDSPATPEIKHWDNLPLRADRSLQKLFDLLAETGNKATFFWLGWLAERMPNLVRQCYASGHEVACHGYGHVLAYQVGPEKFKNDISKGKSILEQITGSAIAGFRAPGFGIVENTQWAFDVIKEAGFLYDASIFPAKRGHGGLKSSVIGPHILSTRYGPLAEVPISVINFFGQRIGLFGGGYLRLTPINIIQFGVRKLKKAGQPLVIYVHPREVDPAHPRLPLGPIRKFKCYINLASTFKKLQLLCQAYSFGTMADYVSYFLKTDSKR